MEDQYHPGTTAVPSASLPPHLALDEDGFLIDPDDWTVEMAGMLAQIENLGPLHDGHWRVIDFIRDRYLRLGAIPPLRHICRNSGLDRKQVKTLFRNCLNAWRIAGLPNPGEEAKTYLG